MEPAKTSKYSDVLGDWLKELGYTHCFLVAGGGCMHLIDGFRTRFVCIPVVHEVAAGVAAEHFNECRQSGKAFALVTSGPGLTNVLTAIAGCYVERRELLVIAGQVKTTDLILPGMRQRGVQEIDGVALSRPIAVQAYRIEAPIGHADFRAMVASATAPHPGPVVIEVCLDTQAAPVDRKKLESMPAVLTAVPTAPSGQDVTESARMLAAEIAQSRRPVILLGGLISRSLAWDSLDKLERLGIPVATTTSAIDRIPSDSPIAAGRPGTWGGQRSANLVIAQADLVIALGAQLDLQQTGFNWAQYAPDAKIYQVYPDTAELTKGHPVLAGAMNAQPDEVLAALLPLAAWRDIDAWVPYVREIRNLVPVIDPANTTKEEFVSPYKFMDALSGAAAVDDIFALCSSGGTFLAALQVLRFHHRQYATVSPAFASMGYGLCTAIGAALARPGQRVILTEGDGGFAQNLQELATVRVNNLPVKMFLFANQGYGSIRATQRKYFGGAYVGCDTQTGLGFPDWPALFKAFGIPARMLAPQEVTPARLAAIMAGPGPEAWIVPIDPEQSSWPAVSSRIMPDGSIISNPIANMTPTLSSDLAKRAAKYVPQIITC